MKLRKPDKEPKKLPNYSGIDKTIKDLLQDAEIRKEYIKAALQNGDAPAKIRAILRYYGITY